MKEGTKQLVRRCVGSAVCGAVIWWIIGFSLFGWTLDSTAKQMATERAEQAVTAALTPFCVQKATSPSETKKLAAVVAVESSWEQMEAFTKTGWATFPGGTEPNHEVAEACAALVLKTAAK